MGNLGGFPGQFKINYKIGLRIWVLFLYILFERLTLLCLYFDYLLRYLCSMIFIKVGV